MPARPQNAKNSTTRPVIRRGKGPGRLGRQPSSEEVAARRNPKLLAGMEIDDVHTRFAKAIRALDSSNLRGGRLEPIFFAKQHLGSGNFGIRISVPIASIGSDQSAVRNLDAFARKALAPSLGHPKSSFQFRGSEILNRGCLHVINLQPLGRVSAKEASAFVAQASAALLKLSPRN